MQSDDQNQAAANAYQDVMVPALMEEWAPRVAEAAGITEGDRVLDVACGTGVLTREVARQVGKRGQVTGIDINESMLGVAKRLSPGIDWKLGSAEALPFADGSFDAVVSQFGLMFMQDPVLALREMSRVLAPGGRIAVAVWASLDDTPAYAAETELLDRLAGAEAGDALRLPFALGDEGRLEELARQAGLRDPVVQKMPGGGRFPSIRTMVEVDVRGWLPLVGVPVDEPTTERILEEAEHVLRPFVREQAGGVMFESPAIVLRARRRVGA